MGSQKTKDKRADASPLGKVKAFKARFKRSPKPEIVVPDVFKLGERQQRALVITVIIALLLGFLLVRGFFGVIILSLLSAIIFHPVYRWFYRKTGRQGMASMLTLLVALLIVIIPLIIAAIATVGEIQKLITDLGNFSSASFSLGDLTTKVLGEINKILASVTNGSYQISSDQVGQAIAKTTEATATFFLNLITSSFSSIPIFVTQAILFMYLFSSMLTNSEKLLQMLKDLNPLGDGVSSMYISRTGEMAKGVVGGQFVIAVAQGVVGAVILYMAGIHYFYFFALLLSFLSIIPLGGGIVSIPIGIIMILTGNVWEGAFVLLSHFFIITNIDNVLRPMLVPKSVRMNSALMMLAVFGGIGLFGFLGIAIGPIVMILVLSTLQIYLPLARAQKDAKAAHTPAK